MLLPSHIPDTTIFLCDFHRAQAWLRWLRATKHGCAHRANELLGILRNIADSMTLRDYHRHVEYLKGRTIYQQNKKLRDYFTIWEVQKEV